jgi:glycosyltransferase involved in cell wall biosynthesis
VVRGTAATQGFGYSVRCGLSEARGDLIVLSEPDGTFAPTDIIKLLAFADDFDLVLGTRTTREMIWEGANMGWFLRLGNYGVAKLVEVLFNTPSLTDVGCTMRLIRREALRVLEPHFTIGGSQFNPEMVILAKAAGLRFVEVPLNYQPRVGTSSVTGSKLVALRVGLSMLVLIARYRIQTAVRPLPSRVPDLR